MRSPGRAGDQPASDSGPGAAFVPIGGLPHKARERARWLDAVVESLDLAIVSVDRDGRIMTWNSAAERLLGHRPDEVIGRPIATLGPAPGAGPVAWMTKENREILLQPEVSPIRDEEGRILGWSAILRRHQGPEGCEADRLRQALETAPIGLAHIDGLGRWLWVNRTLCEMVGSSREELLDGALSGLMPAADPEGWTAREICHVRADGSEAWVRLKVSRARTGPTGPGTPWPSSRTSPDGSGWRKPSGPATIA